MATYTNFALLTVLALLPVIALGDTCLNPSVKDKVYTSTEATLSGETIVIIEFEVTCQNKLQNMNLYAEFNGKTAPCSRMDGSGSRYQVSFSDEDKKIPSNVYVTRFFDEEGYADLRKAQRSGEDTTKTKSLFTIAVDHPGTSQGQGVQSEFVAAGVAVLTWYLAYSARQKLQA